MTLKSEMIFVSLVALAKNAARDRRAALSGSLLLVGGKVQRTVGVTHLIIDSIKDRSRLLGQLNVRSRDFH